jgi:hypothetical protein
MTLLGFIGAGEIKIFLILGILVFILPLIALVDILKNNFEGDSKLIWVIVVIFLPIMGSILYFLIGRNQKIKNSI